MSFRLFVYYCAVAGAWCGFVGWVLGRALAPSAATDNPGYFPIVLRTCIQGMFLGLAIALGLSFLDATFSLTLGKLGKVLMRVIVAVLIGIFAGLFGSFIGGSLYHFLQSITFLGELSYILGWTIVGFLIGMSISAFEVLASLFTRQDFASSLKKLIKCLVGGTIGGGLGGSIAALLMYVAGKISSTNPNLLWSPSAIGFVAIGASIGLLVGLAQIILKEAWIKVEAGFRPGREMLISKDKTIIGRAEGSDIALFGDSGVEKTHASIVRDGGRFYLEDLQSPGGSFVNDQKVQGRAALKAGDLIKVGKSVLRFNERAKRKE